MRRYLSEALVLSVTDITVHSLKPTFLPAAWLLILVVITTEILWLPRIRNKFAKFGIVGGRRMWWSYATVALVGAMWLCGCWLAAQGAFSLLTAGSHAAQTHSESAQQQEAKPDQKQDDKKKEGDKKDAAQTNAQKKDDKQKAAPKLTQESHGDNSPNVATFGDNSPATVTINPEKSPYAPIHSYDFNGARRTSEPGKISVDAGEETIVFQKFVQLQTAKDWKGLRDTCEGQIKKTPEWLTPYLFAGVAYVNLGEQAKGIERLEYVKKKAGGNPDYTDADRLLNQFQPKN